jgi:hypothetical protein
VACALPESVRARRPLLCGNRAAAGEQDLLQPHHRLRMRVHGVDDTSEKGAFGDRREARLVDDWIRSSNSRGLARFAIWSHLSLICSSICAYCFVSIPCTPFDVIELNISRAASAMPSCTTAIVAVFRICGANLDWQTRADSGSRAMHVRISWRKVIVLTQRLPPWPPPPPRRLSRPPPLPPPNSQQPRRNG